MDGPQGGSDDGSGTIVVRGERVRGQLNVEQPPVLELEEADIAAFGAGSIQELVQAVESQAGSSRGRGGGAPPVFLINGIEVSSFREFRSYPPEAIRKVEVLPEEVAQKFGYPPDRRVMNFILKDDFQSREVEAEFAQPDRGGYSRNMQEATLLKIANGGRLNIKGEIEDGSPLTEGERGVVQSVPAGPGEPDPAFFRTLVADSWAAELTANWAKAMLDNGSSVSLNATYERGESLRLSGLDPLRDFVPLERRSSSDTFSTGAGYNRPLGRFKLNTTVDLVHALSEDTIDRRGDSAVDRAHTRVTTLVSKATLSGVPLELPAGDLSTSLTLGFDWKRFASEDTRSVEPVRITRRRLAGRGNVTVPLAERGGAWGAIGDLSLNLSAGVEDLSDFGTLGEYSAGLTWGVSPKLTLTATRIGSQAAPTLTQLGSPQTVTLNVPVFDFATGESVLATIVTGGNLGLIAETQRDWKFGANWQVPFVQNTRLTLEYVRNRSQDVSSAFSELTPVIEAAFPDRVTRDIDGTLLAIDRRPVTFAQTRADRLVFGLTTSGSFGAAGGDRAGGPPAAGRRGPGGGGPPGMGFGNDGRGRFFVNLNHTIELENTVLIAEGGPLLDLLDGDATSGFGLSRHTSTLELGMFRNGKGLRISGRYTGPSRISADGGSDLRFGSPAQIDLRTFVDLGRLFDRKDGVFKDLRLAAEVENVFDERRAVTDANGDTPLSFQPFLVDPTGRYLGIELRKMF